MIAQRTRAFAALFFPFGVHFTLFVVKNLRQIYKRATTSNGHFIYLMFVGMYNTFVQVEIKLHKVRNN